MEKNINKQNKSFNMVKQLMFLLLSLFLINSVTAQLLNPYELIFYKFEEQSGSVILDSSGNANHGVEIGTQWSTNSKYGFYSLYWDNNNDYTQTYINDFPDSPKTFSLWFNINQNNGLMTIGNLGDYMNETIFEKHFEYNYNTNTGTISMGILTTSNITQTINLRTGSALPLNTWNHIIVVMGAEDGTLKHYLNGVLTYNQTAPNMKPLEESFAVLRLGGDFANNNDYRGYMDSFRVFNYPINSTDVASLYTNNILHYPVVSENGETNNGTPIISIAVTDIINSTSITQDEIFLNQEVDLIVNLNYKADCEIYFDDSLYDWSKNLLNFKSTKNFEFGNHSYMLYCEKIIDDTKYFQITPTTDFSVNMGNKAVEFYFYNVNNEYLLGQDYYFVTPCFKSLNPHWIYEEEYYIKNIKDGYAQFNLSYTANYDFCLYRGTINVDESQDEFTDKFDIVDIAKTIKLGSIFVGANTTSYRLKLTTQDIYTPMQPEFWGKTWESLFTLVISVILGGIFVAIGLYARIDKMTIVGGLIIMTGLGVSVWTFVGAIF